MPLNFRVFPKMSVLIGGGTGFVGGNLIALLKRNGLKTKILTRRSGLENSVTWNQIAKHGLPDDVEHVVNFSGAPLADFTKNWEKGYKKQIFDSRIDTTKLLAQAIAKSSSKNVKTFVQTSAVGYYPYSDTVEYTEDSQVREENIFVKLCKEWEAAGDETPENVRRLIFRFGIVLGRRSPFIKSQFWPFFFGLGGKTGDGRQFLPWIHVEDLTQLIFYALKNQNTKGIYNAVAPQIIKNEEFAKSFAKSMDRPSCLGTPSFVVKCIFDPDRAEMALRGQKVVPKRTLESGFQFQYPTIDQACDAIVKHGK